MEKKILPFEMIDANIEGLHAKHHTTSKIIYLACVLIVIAALCSLPYLSVPISTQSRGIINTAQDNNMITSMMYGQIEELYIKENQMVAKGDVLAVINSEKLSEQMKLNTEKIAENSRYIYDVQSLLSAADFNQLELGTPLYIQELLQFQQRMHEKELQVVHAKRELDRANVLFETGTIARAEKEQKEHTLLLVQNTVDMTKQQQQRAWQLELNRYQAENRDLQSSIKQIKEEQQKYVIVAPIDGVISNYSGLQVGNFIAPNQALAYISSNEELIVESFVSPSDIGLIQQGMDVLFQVDAFNYNQWGLAKGKVVEISSDITTVQDQPFFVIKCSLKNHSLSLTNGYVGKFKKGMTLTARYAITERTIYQLLYDKMDDWLNPAQS